jgi:hypothetical protein
MQLSPAFGVLYMDISIKSYQASIPEKPPVQEILRHKGTGNSTAENTGSGTAANISISSSAQALYVQSSAAERQASISQGQLKQLHNNTWSDIYSFSQLLGSRNYEKDQLLPQTDDPARLELGKKSLEYAIALHQSNPGNAPNPFAGMARNDLSAVVYDETGTYTIAERYAASAELRMQDEAYFSKLATKITNGGDNRVFFKSILEYFDELLPVEKSAYPDGYRGSIDRLYQEQLDQWGPLDLITQSTKEDSEKSSESIFNQGQTSEEMLRAVLEKAIGLSRARY